MVPTKCLPVNSTGTEILEIIGSPNLHVCKTFKNKGLNGREWGLADVKLIFASLV